MISYQVARLLAGDKSYLYYKQLIALGCNVTFYKKNVG